MPVHAYILLKMRPISIEEFKEKVKKIEKAIVKSCSLVTGEIDAILEVEAENTKDLFDFAKLLRDIPEVVETRTSIIISNCI